MTGIAQPSRISRSYFSCLGCAKRARVRLRIPGIESDSAEEASRTGAVEVIHCLRDPTRGGVGTTLNEIALASEVHIKTFEE